ncbi:hypothetical protein R1sor_008595 [Riccia sorocarpa]|uniref:FCP1 homology domain-containing protein n=1 Tax=Riccia sorocarpa TaxID=122646 RepID=A0ABD3HW07_9MARC
MEQDADPDAHLGHEDEAASDEAKDGLEPIDMQHMIIHEHRTKHNGAWCIEVDKIFYPHIGNSVFKVKEEMTLFLKVNDKSQNDEFWGVSAKSLKFDMKKTASWVRKKLLISRFWDARSHMYNTGRIASQIMTRAFVVPWPRRIDAACFLMIADLLPFSQKDSSPIVLEIYAKTYKLNWSQDLSLVRALIADPDVVFLAISGQHSSRAQQLLLLETRVPDDVREQNRHRRSRILNGGFDPTKYHDISYLDNKNNETQVFIPSFVECLNKARAQWITLRRPKSTQGSTTKNDSFDQFKSIVCQTMGRRSYKEVIPLVWCSDETYTVFEKFVKRWKEEKIPDVHGTIGPSKDPRTGLVCDRDVSQLSVNRFRPINGLSDSDLKLAWTVLEEGKVWFTKPASYKEQHGSWDHLARAYSIFEKWLKRMLKFIPEKGDKEAVLEEASSSEEESNKNKKKAKKKTVEVLPSHITTGIHRIYTAKHEIAASSRQEPLHILHLPSICQYKLTLDEQLNCKLVFLDVTHPNLVLWGKPEFCSFMGIVRDLTVSKEFTIVSVMEYGQQLVDFTSAIKEMKDAKIIFEVGCYENERPVRKTNLVKPTCQLVYAIVSLGPEENKPALVENFDYRSHSCEVRYKTWKEEFTLDKGVGSEAVNFKNKAPRWDFVGIEPAEGSKPYVHPGSKRRFFCTRLLNNFSSEGSTVLDFFSGGVFAREALLSSRDVIYFASNQLEDEFMAKFGKLLQTHSQRVQDWFETYKKKHGHVEVKAPPQAEQSGAVTVAALTTPFVPDGSVMASAIERLCNITRARSIEADDVASPVQPSDKNDNSEPIELPIAGVPVIADNAVDEVPLAVDEGRPEDNATAAAEEANAQIPGNTSGALALTDKSLWPALDFMQMDNTLVKLVDLLPKKLLILDVEGLLLYAEGFMDKTSRTDCGDVISNGMKAVVRRNGVQALMSRCLELFDVALWSCCSRNTLWDYTHYLFSGEQYNKFLFTWDYNKALDTKEKWTRDNRQISLLLKPLKAV